MGAQGQRTYRAEYYPDPNEEIVEEHIEQFFKFMYDRHMIWVRRFKKGLPREKWTKDKILKETKYTNIYRQLDRGTLWYIKFIMKKYHKRVKNGANEFQAFRDFVFQTIIYRVCNNIETFELTGLPRYSNFGPAAMLDGLDERYRTGLNVMTSAHLTCPSPNGMKKHHTYMVAVLNTYHYADEIATKIRDCKSALEVFKLLLKPYCVGDFTAYEIYCDLCYAKAIPFTINDFVNVGPGAREAIKLTFPSSANKKGYLERIHELLDNQDYWFDRIGKEFPYYNKYEPVEDKLSLRTIEHSLCEFSKYWLQQRGLGKARMKMVADSHATKVSENGEDLIITGDIKRKCKRLSKEDRVDPAKCGSREFNEKWVAEHTTLKEHEL